MCCLLLYSHFDVLLSYSCKEDTEAWEKVPSLYSLQEEGDGLRAAWSSPSRLS